MKKSEFKENELARLAQLLCSGSNANEVQQRVAELSKETVQDLCTTILDSGHTLLHVLAQRQKLQALQALLQHKGEGGGGGGGGGEGGGVGTGGTINVVHTRNAQGATPLHVALHHNSLFSAKVLLDHGANPSVVVSRHKGSTLLHLMVSCDRPHAVLLLLQEGADVNARDLQGRTPFHWAAIIGNPVMAAILMRCERCDLNAVDAAGHTGVMLSILNDNADLARQLVEAPGVDVVQRDRVGMSCLHLAVSRGQLDVVRSLLRRNTANINGKERHMGRTPIHLACCLTCDDDGVVTSCYFRGQKSEAGGGQKAGDGVRGRHHRTVSRAGSETPAWTSRKRCPSSLAKADFVNFVEDSKDVKVNVPPLSVSLGQPGYSKFQRAPGRGHNVPVPNGFLGASTPRTPRTPRTPATPRVARSARTPRTITPRVSTPRLVVSRDCSLGLSRDCSLGEVERANSPLGGVERANSPRRKVTASSSDSLCPSSRYSAADDATPRPRSYLVLTPFKAKHSTCSDTSARSPRPSTAPPVNNNLHRHFSATFPASLVHFRIPSAFPAAGRESSASSAWLRSRDSIVTSPVTPFNVGMVRVKLVALLLSYDADANLVTMYRKSPLHIACLMGAADVLGLLLPHVTNVNVLSAANKTALHLAVERGHAALVPPLLNAGANVAMRDTEGMTALHLAAKLGHADIAAVLLKVKGGRDSCDFRQRTPLHHACLHNHAPVVQLLLKAGARVDRADDDGVMPLEYQERATKAAATQEEKNASSETNGAKHTGKEYLTNGGHQASYDEKIGSPNQPGAKHTGMNILLNAGPHAPDDGAAESLTLACPAAKTGAGEATPLMPQRRRKLGMVQPTHAAGSDATLQTREIPHMAGPMVMCSVVAI